MGPAAEPPRPGRTVHQPLDRSRRAPLSEGSPILYRPNRRSPALAREAAVAQRRRRAAAIDVWGRGPKFLGARQCLPRRASSGYRELRAVVSRKWPEAALAYRAAKSAQQGVLADTAFGGNKSGRRTSAVRRTLISSLANMRPGGKSLSREPRSKYHQGSYEHPTWKRSDRAAKPGESD